MLAVRMFSTLTDPCDLIGPKTGQGSVFIKQIDANINKSSKGSGHYERKFDLENNSTQFFPHCNKMRLDF